MSEPDVGPRPSFLIDMDGVLVHEDDLIPGADRFIKALRQAARLLRPALAHRHRPAARSDLDVGLGDRAVPRLAAAGRHRLRRR
jgi:hypothetical protein